MAWAEVHRCWGAPWPPCSSAPLLRPADRGRVIERLIQAVMATSSRAFGYSAIAWTALLLQAHLRRTDDLEVSERTIRTRLRELGYRYKQPRYVLGRRFPPLAPCQRGLKNELKQRVRTLLLFSDATIVRILNMDKKLYHRRSLLESVNSVIKRKYGSWVRSRAWGRQFREILTKHLIYNIERALKFLAFLFLSIISKLVSRRISTKPK